MRFYYKRCGDTASTGKNSENENTTPVQTTRYINKNFHPATETQKENVGRSCCLSDNSLIDDFCSSLKILHALCVTLTCCVRVSKVMTLTTQPIVD